MPKALIIGGGIGGLTAAGAFVRRGWNVEVFEAAPELRPVGKGIWAPTNAMRVFERLGLADSVAAVGWPLEQIQLRTKQGRMLSRIDLNEIRRRHGQTTISLHRAKLVEALASSLPDGCLHLGKRLNDFEEKEACIVARFEDGSEAEGDLLVGADGIRSVVRERLFPQTRLRYAGQISFRSVTEMTLPAPLAHAGCEVWGGKFRIGFSAIGPHQVYWFATVVTPPVEVAPDQATVDDLPNNYKGFADPIPQIVAGKQAESVLRTDLYDFPPIASWHRGRAVLLGDAAHAMTPNLGQGAAQAVEDAYALAAKAADDSDLPSSLAAYQKARRPKAARIVKQSWRYGRAAHFQNVAARTLRDLALQWAPRSFMRRELDRLYEVQF